MKRDKTNRMKAARFKSRLLYFIHSFLVAKAQLYVQHEEETRAAAIPAAAAAAAAPMQMPPPKRGWAAIVHRQSAADSTGQQISIRPPPPPVIQIPRSCRILVFWSPSRCLVDEMYVCLHVHMGVDRLSADR